MRMGRGKGRWSEIGIERGRGSGRERQWEGVGW